ncbi:MAG: outer membrane protein assembly factor BamC [Pseudomonadota bacterium]
MTHKLLNFTLSLGMLCLASIPLGCSNFGGSDNDYTKSASLPPLEVPPDLTKPDWNTRMSIPGGDSGTVSAVETSRRQAQGPETTRPDTGEIKVLPEVEDIKVRREGNVRWLEVGASTDVLWPRLQAFWKQVDIALEKNSPQVGIMETVWYEQRETLPKGALGRMLGRAYNAFADTGSRDKYRIRVERVSADITNVYLTQRRAEQVGDISDDEAFVRWKMQPPSPELEAEMLARLMIYLGTDESDAKHQIAAAPAPIPIAMNLEMVNGEPVLLVADELSQVWRRTGVALDRAGLFVEQQDQSKGIYYITYTAVEGEKTKGFFNRIFSRGKGLEVNELYQVHLRAQDEQILITAHDNGEDDAPAKLDPEAAEVLLNRLKKAYQIGESSV